MKRAIRSFTVSISLTLFTIQAFSFQQDAYLAKTTSTNFSAATHRPNNRPVIILKDTNSKGADQDNSYNHINTRYKLASERAKLQAASVKAFAKANNFSTEYVFLLDMSLPSGKKRFFVYNLKADSVECCSLVAHGFGSTIKDSEDQLIFSNNNFSCKTSLGKYKVGSSYNGTYGLAYKLYGLDSTNSKAFERAIVLHSEAKIPSDETYPQKIFQSAGCPAVSPTFLPILGNYIKGSKKPILMWIYN